MEDIKTHYYVYILRCADNSLYTGISTDVKRRFSEHCRGNVRGAKYTKSHKPIKVEAVWETDGKSDASKLEYRIKQLKKEDKERLIEDSSGIENIFGAEIKRICV